MLKSDSRRIKPGDTFIALSGVDNNGHDYIDKAIENGATKIIAETGSYPVETLIVPNTRVYLANYLKETYHHDLKDIKILGVTGTNGKTTTAYFTYQLLNKLGVKTAYLGTIGFYLNDKVKELKNTTPDLMDLYEMFLECSHEKIEVIIMEVSSHALELGRVMGIDFDMVSFTNLTQDHLDLHGNFENYKNAKLKLFSMVKKGGQAIVNIDDSYGRYFLLERNHNLTYGFKKSDYQISDYVLNIEASYFKLKVKDEVYEIKINIPGKYNIYNYVNALIMCHNLQFKISDIIDSSLEIVPPKGRFEVIRYLDNVIVIDYAHSPDAVENILNTVREYRDVNKIVTIIGCGGRRDKTKRPIMGKIATDLSDDVIFTNDNPRDESPIDIVNDIIRDLKNDNFTIIYDRKDAIEKGIKMLKHQDILLILGKGHENYQIIGEESIHHDDKEQAKIVIENLEKAKASS